MKNGNNSVKNTILFKIEYNLYREIENIQKESNMTYRDMIFLILEKDDIEIPVQRKVEKTNMLPEFNTEFSFHSTTIQFSKDEIAMLESIFSSYPLTHIIHGLLFRYIQVVKVNWSCPYFNDLYFAKYLYSERDYLNTYNEFLNSNKRITQREYNKKKESHYPSLYAIRKEFGSFNNFVKKMKIRGLSNLLIVILLYNINM